MFKGSTAKGAGVGGGRKFLCPFMCFHFSSTQGSTPISVFALGQKISETSRTHQLWVQYKRRYDLWAAWGDMCTHTWCVTVLNHPSDVEHYVLY
jgi:hypothetical protein